MRRRNALGLLGGAPGLACVGALAGCVSVDLGGDAPAHRHLTLNDAGGAAVTPRAAPLVDALLVQPQPANALADTLSIAYSQRENEYGFYQLASWIERPIRALPRLLQRRLQARGIAAAVGLAGDPMRADWLLGLAVDTVHHDVRSGTPQARLALTVDLYDRRRRVRVAERRFDASAPSAGPDSGAAALAMSRAVAEAFDALLPWLESELQRAAAARS